MRERRPRRSRGGGSQESRTSASISTWPATRAAVMRWRPSRTKSVSPARVSRTGGGSRPSSSHARYRSIFARSRPRSRRRMSASGTQVDVNDAYATRLLPRGRLECGRVESNHHSHWRRGYSALSSPVLGVRRVEPRRPVGFEPTLRGSRPRMLAVTSRPPERNGRRDRLPATGGRDVTVRWPRSQLLYLSAVLPASLRRRHPLTGWPWGLVGPAAR